MNFSYLDNSGVQFKPLFVIQKLCNYVATSTEWREIRDLSQTVVVNTIQGEESIVHHQAPDKEYTMSSVLDVKYTG